MKVRFTTDSYSVDVEAEEKEFVTLVGVLLSGFDQMNKMRTPDTSREDIIKAILTNHQEKVA